ncbi:MAG TPA: hypothetical protein VF263_12025, partial [Longimicrobiaceae bacterium]
DQKQHLEIARDLVVKMNETFGEGTLKLPEPEIAEELAVIPGTDGQKMSKSYKNTINMFGDEKALRKSVMSVVTDSTPLEAPKDPEGSNVVALYKLFATAEEVRRMEDEFRAGGTGYGDFKKRLFEAVMDHFGPMRARRAELERSPDYVDEVLRKGAQRAREAAAVTMDRVRVAIGLR